MTTISFISSAAIKGQPPALHYTPTTAAGDEPFILTETELREIVQEAVVACYDVSDELGTVADFWAVALLHRTPHKPAPVNIAAALNCSLAMVEELTALVREIASDIHEEVTGLPAPW